MMIVVYGVRCVDISYGGKSFKDLPAVPPSLVLLIGLLPYSRLFQPKKQRYIAHIS